MFKKIAPLLPFLEDIKGYSIAKFRPDFIAALTVALILIPQAMADAVIADIHPKYGLYASILPVIIGALFSSSRFMNNGPTGEVSMLFASIAGSIVIGGTALSAMPDEQKVPFLFLLTFLVGVIQIIMGFGKLGNLSNFVSRAVLVGFIVGAGVLTALNQLKNLLGISVDTHGNLFTNFITVMSHINETNSYAFGISIFTIIFIVIAQKISKKIPSYLLAMVITGVASFYFDLKSLGVKFIDSIPQSLPPFSIPVISLEAIDALIMPALAIAILGVLGSLTIAKSIADQSGEEIDGNKELIGQGFSNFFGAFTSSMPGAGSLTRTAANFNAGALTRFSGVMCGIVVLVIVLLFAPFASFIPKAALAGIIAVIAYKMVDRTAFMFHYYSTNSDRLVLLVTSISTLFLTMDKAIYLGVFLSIVRYLRRSSKPDIFEVVPDQTGKMVACSADGCRCANIAIQQIEGALYFASSDNVIKNLLRKDKEKAVILRMKQVRLLDGTGAHALKKLADMARKNNVGLILSAVKPKVLKVLQRSGVVDAIGKENIVEDSNSAIQLAFKKYVDRELCKACPQKLFKEC